MYCKLFTTLLVATAILLSCNTATKQENSKGQLSTATENLHLQPESLNEEQEPVLTADSIQTPAGSATDPSLAKPAVTIDWDKKIIKTGTLKLEVKDFKNFSSTVHKTIRDFGGYIAQEEQHATDQMQETSVTIKVPVDQFEALMNQLSATDAKQIERKINTDDVTGQLIDIKSRLQTKKQMRLKYLDFLKESKNMEDALKVQQEVNNIQEQIEAADGRVAYLSHQSMMSTILLSFYQPTAGIKSPEADPTFAGRLLESFKNGGVWMANLLIALVSIWPWLVLLTAGYFLYKKLVSFNIHKQKM